MPASSLVKLYHRGVFSALAAGASRTPVAVHTTLLVPDSKADFGGAVTSCLGTSPSGVDSVIPKRPVSAFLRFAQEQLPKLKASHPDLAVAERSRLLGKKWAEISEEARKVHKEAAEKDMLVWKEKVRAVGTEQLDGAYRIKAEQRAKKALKKATKEQKAMMVDLGKPARPSSAYAAFVKDSFADAKMPSSPAREAMKVLADKWAQLSPDVKRQYQLNHEQQMAEYHKAMAAWTSAMEKAGKSEDISKADDKVKRMRSRKRQLNAATKAEEPSSS